MTTGSAEPVTSKRAPLDYTEVRQYWNGAKPSPLGPYVMEGFGFPTSAGRFRFRVESKVVERLTRNADCTGTVLDLGSGAGHWTELFARRFSNVIAVEASKPLFDSMVNRCSSHTNVRLVQDDVLSFIPQGPFSLIFLGGMLMYLNERDVVELMRRVTPLLSQGGMILCRESTVRNGTHLRQGSYQAVYRSVQDYSSVFERSGLEVIKVETNIPYILLQLGCEAIDKWKAVVPPKVQALPLVGRLVYCGLRLGYPWIARLPEALGVRFPKLTNHFFLLRARTPTNTSTHKGLELPA